MIFYILRIIPSFAKTYSYNIEVTSQTGMNGLKCDRDDTSFSNCVEEEMVNKFPCLPPWLGRLHELTVCKIIFIVIFFIKS